MTIAFQLAVFALIATSSVTPQIFRGIYFAWGSRVNRLETRN